MIQMSKNLLCLQVYQAKYHKLTLRIPVNLLQKKKKEMRHITGL